MLPFTTYLIDLDGVIYRGNELLPGAKEFITWLKANNKKFLFLTNNSFASETQVLEKLTQLGIVTDTSHLLSAGQAAVQNIARRFPGALVYLVGEPPLIDLLREYQRQLADIGAHKAGRVLMGLDRHLDAGKITRWVRAIRERA